MRKMQAEVHPKIKSFVDVFYRGKYDDFANEYRSIVGSDIDFSRPSAGIVKFIREKWGLSSDVLLGLDKIVSFIKHKKFKSLKRSSSAYAFASALYRFLNILTNSGLLNANELDFRSRILDPKEDAESFINFYGLDKNSINSFHHMRYLLEDRDIYVFALPLDTDFQEGIIYPFSPSFIILNSNIKLCKAGFALAHELGHFLYKNVEDENMEEDLANKFATYLVIPSAVVSYVYEIFLDSMRDKNSEFFFIMEICKSFNCNIHPLTAIERLFLEGFMSKDEKDRWKKKILAIEKSIDQRNSKSSWELNFSKELGVLFSEKYQKAVNELFSRGEISEARANEMMLAINKR